MAMATAESLAFAEAREHGVGGRSERSERSEWVWMTEWTGIAELVRGGFSGRELGSARES